MAFVTCEQLDKRIAQIPATSTKYEINGVSPIATEKNTGVTTISLNKNETLTEINKKLSVKYANDILPIPANILDLVSLMLKPENSDFTRSHINAGGFLISENGTIEPNPNVYKTIGFPLNANSNNENNQGSQNNTSSDVLNDPNATYSLEAVQDGLGNIIFTLTVNTPRTNSKSFDIEGNFFDIPVPEKLNVWRSVYHDTRANIAKDQWQPSLDNLSHWVKLNN